MQFCTAFSLTYVHQSFWLSLYFFIFLHSFMVWPVSAWRMIYLNYQWHEMNWFCRFFFSFFSFNHFWSAIVIELLGFWHWAFGSSQKGVCCPIYHCGCRRNWHLAWHFFYSIDCSWNVQQVGLLVETSQGWEITKTSTQIMI